MPFRFELLEIPEVILVEPERFEDSRGFFMEVYSRPEFAAAGIHEDFVQDNHSSSARGVLRGLHYQLDPNVQGKLVGVSSGEIFDVAVDLRRSSPTFTRWIGRRLSSENRHMLWIPPGFAHGFYALGDGAEVTYKVTRPYSRDCERTLAWDDPAVGIAWPLLGGEPPILSAKDAAGKRLPEAVTYA